MTISNYKNQGRPQRGAMGGSRSPLYFFFQVYIVNYTINNTIINYTNNTIVAN